MATGSRQPIDDPEVQEEALLSLHVAGLPIDPRIAVYSTIILLSGFALVDVTDTEMSWGAWGKVFGAALAPVAAVAVAHGFADVLGLEVRTKKQLTSAALAHVVRHNLQFFYVAAIALLVLAPMLVLGISASQAVTIVILLGTGSLVGWGVLAARRVGLSWRGTLVYALAYGCIGVLVVWIKFWLTH
jgi:hypothetical protein